MDDGDDDKARAVSPFIDVEALSDEDDEIASASESSNDSAPKSTVEAEPVKTDFKEEVEVNKRDLNQRLIELKLDLMRQVPLECVINFACRKWIFRVRNLHPERAINGNVDITL